LFYDWLCESHGNCRKNQLGDVGRNQDISAVLPQQAARAVVTSSRNELLAQS
jgi:hypothetical protein